MFNLKVMLFLDSISENAHFCKGNLGGRRHSRFKLTNTALIIRNELKSLQVSGLSQLRKSEKSAVWFIILYKVYLRNGRLLGALAWKLCKLPSICSENSFRFSIQRRIENILQNADRTEREFRADLSS